MFGLPFLQLPPLKKALSEWLKRVVEVLDLGLTKKDGYATIAIPPGKPCAEPPCQLEHTLLNLSKAALLLGSRTMMATCVRSCSLRIPRLVSAVSVVLLTIAVRTALIIIVGWNAITVIKLDTNESTALAIMTMPKALKLPKKNSSCYC
ncbi:hypothetical protein G6F42_017795 [Rhizopus arrhizus]|nr:hypothetical protein G6F42_017795 [Rhizopus arrhizus]